jgi:uncharacterized membrane protein YdbT with pleckstrin-like domain
MSKGEKLQFNQQPSRWAKILEWTFLVVAIGFIVAPVLIQAGVWFGAFMIIFGSLFLVGRIYHLIAINFTEYAVTNKKVLAKTGIISRRVDELMLKKVEGVDVEQGILGRLLGFGTLVFSGTGSQKVVFDFIDDPLEAKKKLDNII